MYYFRITACAKYSNETTQCKTSPILKVNVTEIDFFQLYGNSTLIGSSPLKADSSLGGNSSLDGNSSLNGNSSLDGNTSNKN